MGCSGDQGFKNDGDLTRDVSGVLTDELAVTSGLDNGGGLTVESRATVSMEQVLFAAFLLVNLWRPGVWTTMVVCHYMLWPQSRWNRLCVCCYITNELGVTRVLADQGV